MITKSKYSFSDSTIPSSKYHLLINPTVGGKPTIIIAPIVINKQVIGNFEERLFISLTFLIPVCVAIIPADRNSIIFPKA